ncbi:MAG: hypothetical protein KKB21_01480 [Nanoarchaeota archaeon]|nr:hypothetical protein [Nanoarchaeota archaeon]MBU4086227.1 hypothetical protein [Nanoarchaeota archaeon]
MNKKIGVYSILLLMLIPMLAASVMAADITPATVSNNVQSAINYGVAAAEPVLKYILGDYKSQGNEFAIRILVLALVTLVIYGVLAGVKIFGEKPWINMTIGIIISLIGIRFMPAGFLESLATPSSALLAVILFGLPFIILFYIGKELPSTARRVMWVVYGVIIFVLWIYNWSRPETSGWNWIYIGFVVACGIAFWFDGSIQKIWRKARYDRQLGRAEAMSKAEVYKDIKAARSELASAGSDAERKHWKAEITRLEANLKA